MVLCLAEFLIHHEAIKDLSQHIATRQLKKKNPSDTTHLFECQLQWRSLRYMTPILPRFKKISHERHVRIVIKWNLKRRIGVK